MSVVAAATEVMRVRDLVVEYSSRDGPLRAVDGASFELAAGETLGIVGESGSGKTTLAMALMGLAEASGAKVRSGSVTFDGVDMLALPSRRRRGLRGKVVAMSFQDPMTSFNPVWTVGSQLMETIRAHDRQATRAEALDRARNLLERVGVPAEHVGLLPEQLSGGMLQRAMIAVAIANQPRVIIADEPVTALDVTVQAQILQLFRELLASTGAGLIIVTHDFGVVAELVDRVLVMYAGKTVELADVNSIFHTPHHPYTAALLRSRPKLEVTIGRSRLAAIPGAPAGPGEVSAGCPFRSRCQISHGRDICATDDPPLVEVGKGQLSACHFWKEVTP
ncbi:MAG: peptide/nickel transport system ATP-binding protein [Actinomycetota bacterium]|jgi:oligopeptide/dipeptide ABC transporter ATP-binding protein|nr:peptide/nickel transport system ATP-binding protein [Actinomycetota bacterium]